MLDERARGSAGAESSTTGTRRTLAGRLRYWWALGAAAVLLLLCGPPVLTVAWLTGRRAEVVYPWALWGARMWLRLCGVEVRVRLVCSSLEPAGVKLHLGMRAEMPASTCRPDWVAMLAGL